MSGPQPADLGTILGIWAHPDDETYSMGGLMAAAVQNGQRVACVTATRGELGSDVIPPEELGPIRVAELEDALGILGVTEHYWLDYPDGGVVDVDVDEAVGRLVALIEEIQPDTVLSFGPDGGTFHPDHIRTYEWVREAIKRSGRQVTHYCNTSTPEGMAQILRWVPLEAVMMTDDEPILRSREECDLYFEVRGELLDRKFAALVAQRSQTAAFIEMAGADNYKQGIFEEAYVLAP